MLVKKTHFGLFLAFLYEPLARFRVEEVDWKRGRSIRIREVLFGILYGTVFQESRLSLYPNLGK